MVGCSLAGPDSPGPEKVAVKGEEVETTGLADAVSGLCLARQQGLSDLRVAKETYDRRSRPGVDEIARALGASYSIQASAVADAARAVAADLAMDPPRSELLVNLARLMEVTREGLARLGIPTPPCRQ